MKLPLNPGRQNLDKPVKAALTEWYQCLFPEILTPEIQGATGITGATYKCSLIRSGRFCFVILTLTGTVTSSGGMIPLKVNPFTPQVLDVCKGGPVPTSIGKAGITNGQLYLPDFSGAVNVIVTGMVVEA